MGWHQSVGSPYNATSLLKTRPVLVGLFCKRGLTFPECLLVVVTLNRHGFRPHLTAALTGDGFACKHRYMCIYRYACVSIWMYHDMYTYVDRYIYTAIDVSKPYL